MELLDKPAQTNPIPASIVRAITKVMLGMTAVKKSQYNKHGNYNFSSTDDIYAALSLKMAEAGLICLCLEDSEPEVKEVLKESLDKNGEKVSTRSQWMRIRYKFVLATDQDTWTDDKVKRSLWIQITGAQTFQAAQSYAEKSWLRSLFKIATGDMDLDGMPQEDEEGSTQRKGRAKADVVKARPNGSTKPLPPLVGQA